MSATVPAFQSPDEILSALDSAIDLPYGASRLALVEQLAVRARALADSKASSPLTWSW